MSWVSVSTAIAILSFVLDIYVIGRVISREHGVERTLAWIFAVLAFPILGAVTYFLIASPNIKRTTRKKRIRADQVKDFSNFKGNEHSLLWTQRPHSEQIQSLFRLTSALTGLEPTCTNTVTMLKTDESAFQRIEQCLHSAEKYIWTEYYIIRNDETGKRFLDILVEKAAQGIQVYLLYDALGSMQISASRLRKIKNAGGKTVSFLPFNPLRRRWAVHLRNHRKIIIIDGKLGFTGGMNVGDEYSGRGLKKGEQHFHDSHLEITGPAVVHLSQIFAEDWAFATQQKIICPKPDYASYSGNATVAILPSGPEQEHNANGMTYLSSISLAQKTVYLTSPYFIPDEPLLKALINAALRGLDVRLLVPEKCDVKIVGNAGRAYYPPLVRAGVRIYEYTTSMLHAKTVVIDGEFGIVGSANLDIRSFRLNFELGAFIADPDFAALLQGRFINDLSESKEVTLDYTGKLKWYTRSKHMAARLLSPIL